MSTLAAIMQLLVAAAFVSIPVVRHRFGPAAKPAAVAELRRQHFRPEVLGRIGAGPTTQRACVPDAARQAGLSKHALGRSPGSGGR
ncbi:hypothetical protein [Streptomyces sp. NPDC005969]|uniref:hypothetical protein n=1 Tax=Streptomyces sp. NPDC005969 TaxID=3156722 RepID=UPI0033CCC74F